MQILFSVVTGLLSFYVQRLATQEFADFVLRKIARAIVSATATKQDDEALDHIERFIDGNPAQK